MKKVIISIACLFALIAGIKADNDRITTDINELPVQSRKFIQKWFSNTTISHIKVDNNFSGIKDYEVLLVNGIEIEFDRSGEWKEIDGNQLSLPEGILPGQVINQIRSTHPGQQIRKIEKDGTRTEVKLTNRVELTFNQEGQLISLDD